MLVMGVEVPQLALAEAKGKLWLTTSFCLIPPNNIFLALLFWSMYNSLDAVHAYHIYFANNFCSRIRFEQDPMHRLCTER